MTVTRSILILIHLFFVAACSQIKPFIDGFHAYEGPPRNPKETATVFILNYGPSGYAGLHGYILSVDGRSTVGFSRPAPLEVYVLPGMHKFQLVAGDGMGRRADGAITFETKVEHTYEIKAALEDKDSIGWRVEDKGVGYRRDDEPFRKAEQERENRKK